MTPEQNPSDAPPDSPAESPPSDAAAPAAPAPGSKVEPPKAGRQPGQPPRPPAGQKRPQQRGERPGGGPSGPPRRPVWEKTAFLAEAVANGIDREFIKTAQHFAREAGRAIDLSAVRGVYGEVARLDLRGIEGAADRLLLLKPRLACLAAREGGAGLSSFRRILEEGIDKVLEAEGAERQTRFERFRDGLEAMLAYQRAYGSKGRS